jgi:hypothetical protein
MSLLMKITSKQKQALRIGDNPVAYCGLKIITSLSLRFPDFQRRKPVNLGCLLLF